MRRFALFGGERHYASGGWGDFIGSYSSLGDAVVAGASLIGWYVVRPSDVEDQSETHIEWWHVADLESMETVASCRDDEHHSHSEKMESHFPNVIAGGSSHIRRIPESLQ